MVNPNNFQNSLNKICGSNAVSANYYVNIMSGTTITNSYKSPKSVSYL